MKTILFSLVIIFLIENVMYSQNTTLSYDLEIASSNRDVKKGKLEYKPALRQQWYLERRRNIDGTVPNIEKKNFNAVKKLKKRTTRNERDPHGSWSFLGPNTTVQKGNQGRVNSIDIHPTNNDIIYLCTPNGGIWHTTNAGFSWSALTDHLGLLSFADLAISNANPDIIYAVSGDGDALNPPSSHGQYEVLSAGIFKSNDAGETWHRTKFEFPEDIVPHNLTMHPVDPNIQFLATKSGLYKTTDGWDSNVQKQVYTSCFDIEFHPSDPSIVYVSGSNKIHVSTNTGGSWDPATDSDFNLNAASRIELAVTPDFPDRVAALASTFAGNDILLYISDTNGEDDTWTLKDNTTNLIGPYLSYCIGLAIDPSDYTTLYGGGILSFKSENSGQAGSWSQIGDGVVHADVHDIVIRGNRIYIASDGGLFLSIDQGNTWTDLSDGLHITEIYRIAGTEDNSELFLLGAQDNGTQRRQLGTTFDRRVFGDGMTCLIDHSNADKMYASKERLTHLQRSIDGGYLWDAVEIPSGQGAWITPVIMDPFDPTTLFVGKDSIYRSWDSGDTWQFIGAPADDSLNLNNLAQGTSNRSRLYASQGGRFFMSNNALSNPGSNVTWTEVGDTLPALFITDIAVDPSNSLRVFITMGGYTGGQKVYETPDGGNTWTNISGSLPNVPALTIAFHDDGSNLDKLYIGNDIGVFYRDDNIGDWIYFSNFLPAVPVEDLYINNTNGTLAAGTYGRGLWRSDLISNCENNAYFSSGLTHKGQVHLSYNQIITSLAKVSTEPGTEIFYSAGLAINLMPGFRAPVKSAIEMKIGGCPY